VSWPIQDEADGFLALLASASGSPALKVFDGAVDQDSAFDGPVADLEPPYALVYFYIETPDGLAAPDAVSLTFDSDVIDAWAYVHCVGAEPQAARAARAVAGRARATVLNKTLTVAGRSCFPIRWREGQPPQRNEDTGPVVFDQVDAYSWRSVPG
jgi:uncharacterized protein YndB with AHSA1/START domain